MTKPRDLRLSVNIDHIATVRNARGGQHPSVALAARAVLAGGAHGVTAHLREDRRHISDEDAHLLADLLREEGRPFNLEFAATEEMTAIALRIGPETCCIVPENRKELTTEGGLDVTTTHEQLAPVVATLKEAGIRVALFVDPYSVQLDMSRSLGADAVELHTGTYTDAIRAEDFETAEAELTRLRNAAKEADGLGLQVHAGHGLGFDTVERVAAIPEIVEMSIGHWLVGEAVFSGLEPTVRQMRGLMDRARQRKTPLEQASVVT